MVVFTLYSRVTSGKGVTLTSNELCIVTNKLLDIILQAIDVLFVYCFFFFYISLNFHGPL